MPAYNVNLEQPANLAFILAHPPTLPNTGTTITANVINVKSTTTFPLIQQIQDVNLVNVVSGATLLYNPNTLHYDVRPLQTPDIPPIPLTGNIDGGGFPND